jgi:hypothetical protein
LHLEIKSVQAENTIFIKDINYLNKHMGLCHTKEKSPDLISNILLPIRLDEVSIYNRFYPLYDTSRIIPLNYINIHKLSEVNKYYAIIPLKKSVITTPENTAVAYKDYKTTFIVLQRVFLEKIQDILNSYETVWYKYVPGESVYTLKTRDPNINKFLSTTYEPMQLEFIYAILLVPIEQEAYIHEKINNLIYTG